MRGYGTPYQLDTIPVFVGLLRYIWIVPLPFSIFYVIGLFHGMPHIHNSFQVFDILKDANWGKRRVVISWVTRGKNQHALFRSISQTITFLHESGVDTFDLEVVTDAAVDDDLIIPGVKYIIVPREFKPINGTKFKARAIEYGRQQRILSLRSYEDYYNHNHSTWVLHVDEESVVTPSAVLGIYNFICDNKTCNYVGQGEIQYNAYQYGRHFAVAAVDALRTGDDLSRFRSQFSLFQAPYFGLHGSYLLLPCWVEDAIGFDHGPHASITEDAYFGLIAAQKGIKFGWIEGIIQEQSPFNLSDLIKQRTRWMSGIRLILKDDRVHAKSKVFIIVNYIGWVVGLLIPVITVLNVFIHNAMMPIPMIIIAGIINGLFGVVYFIGWYRNQLHSNVHPVTKAGLGIATILGWVLLFSPIIEAIGMIRSFIIPDTSFVVIDKN